MPAFSKGIDSKFKSVLHCEFLFKIFRIVVFRITSSCCNVEVEYQGFKGAYVLNPLA